jgi:hypothetical protein
MFLNSISCSAQSYRTMVMPMNTRGNKKLKAIAFRDQTQFHTYDAIQENNEMLRQFRKTLVASLNSNRKQHVSTLMPILPLNNILRY